MDKNKIKIKNVDLFYFESLDSTSSFARTVEIDKEGLIVAETQTAGRGRVGHDFYSPKGGMYFSYVFKDDRQLGDLTVAVGHMVLDRIVKHCSKADAVNLSIHGVNDIFLGDLKICGILCEHILDRYIVGIGINTGEYEFPDELKTIAGYIKIQEPEKLLVSIIEDIKLFLKS